MPHTDIAVIGAGLVGHSLAAALQRYCPQYQVCLIESTPRPDPAKLTQFSPSFDDRTTAISKGTAELLNNWGLWPALEAQACAITDIEVSEQGGLKTAWLESNEMGLTELGYVIPNRWLGQQLYQNSLSQSVQLQHETEISELTFYPDRVELLALGDHVLNARLVILADGGRSNLKQKLGIHSDRLDFKQQAIIANVETSEQHRGRAYERFTPDGAIALLPQGNTSDKSSLALVWSVSAARADALMALPDEEFLQQAQQCFGGRLGRWTKVSQRHHYPLQRVYSAEQVRSRLVLLGNSAVSLHPIAGQGLNLALRGVSALVTTLANAHQDDPGQLSTLLEYQRTIQPDQLLMMRFCDSLIQGFGIPGLLPKLVRAMGIGLLDQHSLAKSRFARFTMGVSPGQLYEPIGGAR